MKRRLRSLLGLAATYIGLLGLLAGCVSRDAGYQDVRKVVTSRTGYDVRWAHLEGDAASQKAVRELLGRPLTSENAVRVALLNSSELQAAFEELGVARAELVSALRLPNPVAEGSVRFRKEQSATLDFVVSEDLTQLIFLPLRNGVAQAELEAAKASVAGRALDLVLQVRSAFYGYLADRQILEFRETVLKALEGSATVAKAQHEAGNVTDLDLDTEQVLYDEAKVNFTSAQTALAASRERLGALLGLWGKAAEWRVDARLVDPPAEFALADLEASAIEHSLDLAIIKHRFEAAAKRSNLAKAEGWLPELKAGVTAEREEKEWSYGPLAEIQVPLFYQGQGEVDRARAEMRRQRQLLVARAVQIRAAARTTATRLSAARERALYIKTVLLPARERILNQTQLQYNAMSVSVFQLLLARRDEVEAARSYVEALREYWTARAEAEQLRSGRLPSGSMTSEPMESAAGRASRASGGH
ncbi:MAG TPA: TolC family protein [Polyangiaceae bacterium]|nr:TolC family protein [Polyangiaceae bacterium]